MGDRVQGLPGDRIVPHAVKYRRAIAGIDRDELAKRLTKATGDTWTKTMIVNLENQRRVVSVGLAVVLAEALGCTLDDLVGDLSGSSGWITHLPPDLGERQLA